MVSFKTIRMPAGIVLFSKVRAEPEGLVTLADPGTDGRGSFGSGPCRCQN
jgi:hypothetical protein